MPSLCECFPSQGAHRRATEKVKPVGTKIFALPLNDATELLLYFTQDFFSSYLCVLCVFRRHTPSSVFQNRWQSDAHSNPRASTVVCRIIANRINDWSWLNDLLAVGRTMPLGFHPEAPCRNEATPVRLKSSGEKKIQTIAFTAIFMHEFHAISKCTHHTHTNTENKYKPTPRALAGHSLLLCSALRRTVQTNARIPLQSPHSPPSIRCYLGATWFSLPAPFPSY